MGKIDQLLSLLFFLSSIIWWLLLGIFGAPFLILGVVGRQFLGVFYSQFHGRFLRRIFLTNHSLESNYIKRGEKLLDLGCGNGVWALEISEKFGASVVLADIADANKTKLPFYLFDGSKADFPDKSFDVVLLNFVLHHTPNPIVILKEAIRLSRGKIIIYEDNASGIIPKMSTTLHGAIFNIVNRINNKATFHSFSEWKKIFISLHLKILFAKTNWKIDSLTYPVKQCFFVLKT